jgi:hypothetical protein
MPRNVHLNVTTAILDASAFVGKFCEIEGALN